MKRSEMVQGIKDYLDLTEEEPEFIPDSLERANYILDFCEMLGMLPPERVDEHPLGYGGGWVSDEDIAENYFTFKHSWEPEDA